MKRLEFAKEGNIGMIKFPSFSFVSNLLEIRDEFLELCLKIEMSEEIKVIIITAFERDEMEDTKSLKEELSLFSHLPLERFRFSEGFSLIDRPCICAIPNKVKGVGLEIVLACDIRVAAEGAVFSFSHLKEGLIPWDGMTQRLPRLVGMGRAFELLLTAKSIDASEARRIGLINRIVPKDSLMDETKKLAQEMASKAPISLRFIREAIYKGLDLPLEHALRMEGDLYLLLFTTEDRSEGIKAFREKRKPIFKGE